MAPLNAQAGAVSLRAKLVLFIFVLILAYILLDVWPLMRLHTQIKYTHIQETQLNQMRQLLFEIYLLKTLWLVILSGVAIGFGYWIIKPFKAKNTGVRIQKSA